LVDWIVCVTRIFSFICMFCRSLFVLLLFFLCPLCCLFFFDIRILITPLVSLPIALSVLLRYTDSDYPFGIFWSLGCLFLFDIRILITTLVSVGHCVFCSPSIYGFWLSLWYMLVIVLSVLLRYTDSNYPFSFCWSLCCLFFDIRILITPLVSVGHCVVCSPSIYGSDYPFGICLSLCCLFSFDIRILITPLVSLPIALSVLLRYTNSDNAFGIF
jgi:hypothetical protein